MSKFKRNSSESTANDYKDRIAGVMSQLDAARYNLKEERKRLKTLRKMYKAKRRVQSILQEVAEKVQNSAHKKIASLVTHCLALVFDDPYSFKVKFEKKRNKTEASFILLRDGKEFDPDDSTGGGVLDVVAFALRLASLCMQLPPRRRIMILDEPFRHLSADRRPRVRAMIEMLAEKMQVQFIIATHMKSLQMGTVVDIQK